MEEKKDFATSGTESFKLEGVSSEKIVLNIDDEKEKAIILNKGGGTEESGNFLVRAYKNLNSYLLSKSGVKVKDKANF